MESDEDYYAEYSSDFISCDGGDETDTSSDDDGVEEELPETAASGPRKNYRVLNEDDLRRLRENDISTVCDTLCVSRADACTLLCRNNWNPGAVYEDWLAAGEVNPPEYSKRKLGTGVCTICFDETVAEHMISLACGHPFCRNCWRSYINISIKDGPGCLTLSCPEPKCRTYVGTDMVDWLCCDEDRKKYHRFLHRSCVESHPARKWCPGPGCDFAVEFDDGDSKSYDVTCDCSFKFCWNCTGESHRPADCQTVAKWAEKNNSEAENTAWILVNTKPCPKCGRSIEKNQGCNHMTCQPPCRYHFCWICLGAWASHKDFYNCHKYEEKKKKAEDIKLDETRERAKMHLERYTHFYERFDANDKSWKRALIDLGRARNEHVMTLGRSYNELHGQLQFLVEAWDQIVECRRVLKWSYAYGYYLPDKESRKKSLFEYLQGQAETALERLHHCAEIEMEDFLVGDPRVTDFVDFRSRLAGLTSVTKTYFQNLVSALENNLSEVV